MLVELVSRAMHARNIRAHITNLLSRVTVTPSIQAAEQAGEDAVRYFQGLERLPSVPSATQNEAAAKALAVAEAAFKGLKEEGDEIDPAILICDPDFDLRLEILGIEGFEEDQALG
ncbi:hypothetical protein [Microvirga zambiensis]|uniref:hypothetical protein n=1 Tax=Microvirga zambiensis TaxID=1402137 RepID=UPI001AEF8444|nr:hypothetical protein [Microvirga zambiensis]